MFTKPPNSKLGFTLYETLLTLLVSALIMHSMNMAVTSYHRVEETLRTDKFLEFQLFIKILSLELNAFESLEVSKGEIHLNSSNKSQKVIHANQKIYKTPGHQPYLYDVLDWQLTWSEPLLTVTVTFNNNQKFSATILTGD
ncbi:ComGF family competence protein [Fundicoccus ignavus]|uniref:Prepilin-type N-terminal cleavage/methylation domain-containing protein n=1 Tax=Fundicoccus ignavus TaxID=2664442 RepID=A0A844CCN4_9LACT|nr:ComGF family competence protein [Fundicoccus ignavus]MRJ48167.1 hypothetical protein [Fundicoccus ignavus]